MSYAGLLGAGATGSVAGYLIGMGLVVFPSFNWMVFICAQVV